MLRFGPQLMEYREAARLSQSQLANRISINHSTIGRLESGDRVPSRSMVLKLARGLRISRGERIRLMASAGFLDRSVPIDLLLMLTQDPDFGIDGAVLRALDAMAEVDRRLRGLMTIDEEEE